MKPSNQGLFSRMGKKEYILVFCLTVMAALFLLIVAAYLPQSLIQEHMAESIDLVYEDLANNYILDKSEGSQIDVFTDIMMLRTSVTTNDRYLGSVLTNPVYAYNGLPVWEGSAETLAKLTYGEPADSVWFYARYWMGFRVVLRLALTFLNYAQIKRYLSFLFLILFAAVICSVSKHANSRIAFLFALSIILVRPHVMASSMQLTCCFFIAFGAMLLIPWLRHHGKWEGLFFMELGMLTMYFDFYTVPLVTMGFPLLYLCILKREEPETFSVKDILKNLFAWFAGYGLMWVAKLGLTSVLTSVDALGDGFASLFSRIGIAKDMEFEAYYSLEAAFEGIWKAVFSDGRGMAVYLFCVGILLAVVFYKVLRGRASCKTLAAAWPYLLFAAIPFAWFVITKQPIALHYFFQYRTIALSYWSIGVFLYYLLPAKDRELADIK